MAQPINNTTMRRIAWLSLIVFGALWAILVYQLGAQWSVYPQYGYGWSVPFLMLMLLWKRLDTRPEPAEITNPALPGLILAALAVALFPIRVIEEANPIWRLASWAMTFEVVGMTLCAIYFAGGRSWLKHFAPPILFFLVAVPWPSHPENAFIQGLTQFNAHATVEALSWFGIPALTHGNVIEISAGPIGIDEACSGIRSFQATLMISLFLGELYRLDARRRIALVLSGAGLALLSNMARTFLLVWVCARRGLDALHAWHDPAGFSILMACFVGLWLVSLWLRGKTGAQAIIRPAETTPVLRGLPQWSIVLLGLWLMAIETGTRAWYRAHETAFAAPQEWSVQWPVGKPLFQDLPISSYVRRQLSFDEGKSASWREENGSQWQLYYFRWHPAQTLAERVRLQFAKSHRPESCLPATGMTLSKDFGFENVTIRQLNLPFHTYRFDDRGMPLHVYFCVWEDGTQGNTPGNMRENAWARLQAARTGNRSLGQRVLEIAVWGIPDDQDAHSAFKHQLQDIIRD